MARKSMTMGQGVIKDKFGNCFYVKLALAKILKKADS